jgi:hypothetical protein
VPEKKKPLTPDEEQQLLEQMRAGDCPEVEHQAEVTVLAANRCNDTGELSYDLLIVDKKNLEHPIIILVGTSPDDGSRLRASIWEPYCWEQLFGINPEDFGIKEE